MEEKYFKKILSIGLILIIALSGISIYFFAKHERLIDTVESFCLTDEFLGTIKFQESTLAVCYNSDAKENGLEFKDRPVFIVNQK